MGFRLRIVAGPGLGSELTLDDSEVTIGRAPENGLVINDNNVSRVHAKVSVASGRVIVADAGSRNGVYVNDRKIAQQPINPGDRVVIGQTVLELFADGGAAPAKAARPVAPRASGPVPATGTQRQPGGNGRGNAIATRQGGPMAKPKPKSQGGFPIAALFGVVGVVAIFAIAAVVMGNNGGKPGPGGNTGGGTAMSTHTPPPMPMFNTPGDGGGTQKITKQAQQWIDVGDSNQVSGNLKKAQDAYRNAMKADPTCLSCDVRLKAVEAKIDAKIEDYTRAGELQFDSGDYKGAIDRWKIAQEFIGDPKNPKWMDLQNNVNKAAQLVQKQPQ